MQNGNVYPSMRSKKFEVPGSMPHYPQLLSFTIDYMMLKIKPDFDSNTLKDCTQKLKIIALEDINEINLDIAEIDVYQVISSSDNIHIISFDILKNDDKLLIKLGQILQKGNRLDLTIRYSAGYYRKDGVFGIYTPRSGFHFISSSESSPDKQAWTQGQALESKYWFPCLDDPQVKFPREIQVTVPTNDFIVMSNGELAHKEGNTWTWIELNPTPAYLTSVVIGKFAQEQQEYCYHDDNGSSSNCISLLYYWPKEISKIDAMLTFANTPIMMRFFEGYFGMKYPYKKYLQVAVEEFEFGGMENTNCTILTKHILHDEIAAIDYTRDIDVVSHELAHQWFGDLVTCRDWSNIWLNEGFATYCETLYWESTKGYDEFCYKVMKLADDYLEESRHLYKRPIVTRIYKHPDDLFDTHSYEKGACVLHMLRNDIGDNNFRKSINNYLVTYKNNTTGTDDLLKIVQDISRKSMHRFFDQWVYRSGHPELDIEFSLVEDSRRIKIKITQRQREDNGGNSNNGNTERDNPDYWDLFEFTLDVRIVFSTTTVNIENNNSNSDLVSIRVSQRITDHSIEIPNDARIEWISIDPQFKILKEIKSVKITNETNKFQLEEILKNQLRKGRSIIERIEAARILKNQYSDDVVDELQNEVIADTFYGVSIEAANTLGSYHEKNNYAKTNKAYQSLLSCLNNKEIFSRLHPEVKQAIVRNIGQFERKESTNLLESLLYQQNESYFLRANAATAIGKSSKNEISDPDNIKKERIISLLKENVKISESFRNVIASGAIDGLKEFSKDNDKDIVVDIANFLIVNTNFNNEYFKRLAATSALSKFLCAAKNNHDNDEKNIKLDEMNQKVFNQLLRLLKDKRRRVKINACKALADNDAKPNRPDSKIFEAIDALIYVAEHDLDGFVRKEAERCASVMREWIKEWSSKPPIVDVKIRKE
jgi:aminopeptidase N